MLLITFHDVVAMMHIFPFPYLSLFPMLILQNAMTNVLDPLVQIVTETFLTKLWQRKFGVKHDGVMHIKHD
jgi:hypothetical protein